MYGKHVRLIIGHLSCRVDRGTTTSDDQQDLAAMDGRAMEGLRPASTLCPSVWLPAAT
jgi:hypothetical protein